MCFMCHVAFIFIFYFLGSKRSVGKLVKTVLFNLDLFTLNSFCSHILPSKGLIWLLLTF